MLDEIASPDEVSHPLTTTTSESTWESFERSSAVQPPKVDNIFVSEEHQNSSKNGELSTEDLKPSEPKAVARKSSKRNKWKPEEIKRLIKKRAELDDRFQAVKGRMVLWEEVASSLLDHGINRTPAQCKSLWASLVQKYEVTVVISFIIRELTDATFGDSRYEILVLMSLDFIVH